MSPITTHVLDTARGKPAAGVAVTLEQGDGRGGWKLLAHGVTNADGRVPNLLPDGAELSAGTYRLRFATGDYFRAQKVQGFYPEVQVVVAVEEPKAHYHIPLLLSPFGYSTYRGS
jgi:5-hydroxyisourate hydrolase